MVKFVWEPLRLVFKRAGRNLWRSSLLHSAWVQTGDAGNIYCAIYCSFLKVGLHNRNRRSHAIFQLHVQRCFCFRRPCILQNNEQHKNFVLPIWFRHSVCTYSRAHQTCDTLRSWSFEIHTHSMSVENLSQ